MIVYRLVKGAPLTIAEFDGNFHDVDDRITSIEDNPPEARSIEDIFAVGNSLFVSYNDSTEDGPFPMPTLALRGRGEWAPATVYAVNDAVTANGIVYVVQFAHTSGASFDAGANDGNGHDFYAPLFNMPELSIPDGGGLDFVLAKVSDDDFDFQWVNAAVPRGGTAGQVLTKLSSDDRDAEFRSSATLVPSSDVVSDSTFTPDATQANTYFRCVHPSGCLVNILAGIFPLDSELIFRQATSGGIMLVAGPDVEFEGIDGFDERTETRGAIIHCKLVEVAENNTDGIDLWEVWGLLAESTV